MTKDLSSDPPRRSRTPESARGPEPAQNAESVAEKLDDLLRLMQWSIVHGRCRTGWAKRNPGMWWCFDCGSPAPTDFDPYALLNDGEVSS